MVWLDKNLTPLPKAGKAIVSVVRLWGEVAAFTDVVVCDEIGPIGRNGDLYPYAEYITHWMPMPEPAVKAMSLPVRNL